MDKLKELINKQKFNTKKFTFQVWPKKLKFEKLEFG
jgi:hypothetical protein